MTRTALIGMIVACVVGGGGPASAGDHLKCMTVKDPLHKGTFPMVTLASDTGRPTENGCVIKAPAKLCCDAVDESGVPSQPGGAGPGNPTTPFCCYQVKCPKGTEPPMSVADEFGTRDVQPKLAKLVCAPITCPEGQTLCGTECVDLTTSSDCGACGNQCVAANGIADCVGGHCAIATCDNGFADCDGDPANGCEANVGSDPANCGFCGHECTVANGTAGCALGQCTIASCAPGFADCDETPVDGCETDTATNPSNCGACGNDCNTHVCLSALTHVSSLVCNDGTCDVTGCDPGYFDTDGVCNDGCECADAGTGGTSCAAAADLGTIFAGQTTDVTDNLPAAGQQAWYQLTFGLGGTPSPKVTLTPGTGEFIFTVLAPPCNSLPICTGTLCRPGPPGTYLVGVTRGAGPLNCASYQLSFSE